MIVGVIKINSSTVTGARFSLRLLKSHPRIGIVPRKGTLSSLMLSVLFLTPPITTVAPLSTKRLLVASFLLKAKANPPANRSCLPRCHRWL